MSDVVVHVAVSDDRAEHIFLAVVEDFIRMLEDRAQDAADLMAEVPIIMIKTIPSAQAIRKCLTFQDRQTAAEFLALWRQECRKA